jgi:hypothetical protein
MAAILSLDGIAAKLFAVNLYGLRVGSCNRAARGA